MNGLSVCRGFGKGLAGGWRFVWVIVVSFGGFFFSTWVGEKKEAFLQWEEGGRSWISCFVVFTRLGRYPDVWMDGGREGGRKS
jgi:hypothetical protein